MPYFIRKNCTRCGACLPECPTGSITASVHQYVIDSDSCADHAACVAVCPVDAIAPLKRDARTGLMVPPRAAEGDPE